MENHTTYAYLCEAADNLANGIHEAENRTSALRTVITKLKKALVEQEHEKSIMEASLGAIVEKRDRLASFYPTQEEFDPVFGF